MREQLERHLEPRSATSSAARSPTSRSTSGSTRSSSPALERRHAVRAGARPHPHLGPRPLPAPVRPAAARPRATGEDAVVEIVDAGWRPGTRTAPSPVGAGEPRRGAAAEPEVHLRAVRDRARQPLRPRGGAGRGRAARPGLQPALHPRPARASARPTSSTRSATTSRASAPASRVRYATVEEFTTEFVARRPRAGHRRASRSASAASTSCCSTTSSSSPTRRAPRRSSSTPSTRCATPAGSW